VLGEENRGHEFVQRLGGILQRLWRTREACLVSGALWYGDFSFSLLASLSTRPYARGPIFPDVINGGIGIKTNVQAIRGGINYLFQYPR
jgi:hypothetical protein